MVLLFGFGPGEGRDLGEVAPVTCPNCHNNVFQHRLHHACAPTDDEFTAAKRHVLEI